MCHLPGSAAPLLRSGLLPCWARASRNLATHTTLWHKQTSVAAVILWNVHITPPRRNSWGPAFADGGNFRVSGDD